MSSGTRSECIGSVGILWRGDPASSRGEFGRGGRLQRVADALRAVDIAAEPVVYADDAVDEVRKQLQPLDGVLVWVDPISEDDEDRSRLDPLLREVAARGVWVSTHPDVRRTCIGARASSPTSSRHGWRCLPRACSSSSAATADTACGRSSGPARLPDGMIRCYLCQDEVVGFAHQFIRALLPTPPPGSAPEASQPGPRIMYGAAEPRFVALRTQMEADWVPALCRRLGIERSALPVIWDADFLFGPRTDAGDDTFVLCEINVSSVFPFPDPALAGLSERLLVSHHDNNYAGAVRNLNKVEEELAKIGKDTPGFLVSSLRDRELTFTNSLILHELYFGNLGGDGKAAGAVQTAIAGAFGGSGRFEELYRATGMGLAGGSGWVVLDLNFHTGDLRMYGSSNHTQSVASGAPLLVMDMYEHAYALDYGASAAAYIDAFMANVRWDEVNRRYEKAVKASQALRA